MEARLHSVSPTLKPCDTSEAAASRPSPTPTLAPQNGGLSVNTDPMVYEERSSLSWLWWLLIIPGVLLLAVGCLIWISQQGMFDFLSYTGKVIVDKFRPHAESVRYGDYVLEKNENRKTGGFGFLLITGAAFIAIALLFMALFYIY